MNRDCQHGRQVGKCAECDVGELEQENRLLRARNERLEKERRPLQKSKIRDLYAKNPDPIDFARALEYEHGITKG